MQKVRKLPWMNREAWNDEDDNQERSIRLALTQAYVKFADGKPIGGKKPRREALVGMHDCWNYDKKKQEIVSNHLQKPLIDLNTQTDALNTVTVDLKKL